MPGAIGAPRLTLASCVCAAAVALFVHTGMLLLCCAALPPPGVSGQAYGAAQKLCSNVMDENPLGGIIVSDAVMQVSKEGGGGACLGASS